MKIRIATLGWRGAAAAVDRDDAEFGITPKWVELAGVRYTAESGFLDAKVIADDTGTVVTLTFVAAAEMVLVDSDGEVLT